MFTVNRLTSHTTRYSLPGDESPSVCAVCETDGTNNPAEIYVMITLPDYVDLLVEIRAGWEEKDPPFSMDGFTIYTISLIAEKQLPVMERYGMACIFAERTICEFERVLFESGELVVGGFDAPSQLQ